MIDYHEIARIAKANGKSVTDLVAADNVMLLDDLNAERDIRIGGAHRRIGRVVRGTVRARGICHRHSCPSNSLSAGLAGGSNRLARQALSKHECLLASAFMRQQGRSLPWDGSSRRSR